MVKIEYTGLSSQNSTYKNQLYIEGFLEPSEDFVISVDTNWNGKNYVVQHIYYDTYLIEFTLRESDYQEHQKIQYASKIILYQHNVSYSVSIVEFSVEKFVNEFYTIKIKFKHEESKKTGNVILSNSIPSTITVNALKIKDPFTTFFTTNIILDEVEGVEYKETVVSEFKEKIIDYTIIKEYFELRFFLTRANLITFYQNVGKIGQFSDMKFEYKNVSYKEFALEQTQAGEELTQMTIKLYKNNRVELPTYQAT
jgi:hypothetical protein